MESLWRVIDTGGFAPGLDAEIVQFNGVLFHEPSALPLTEAQLDLLIEAAEAEWRDVEPEHTQDPDQSLLRAIGEVLTLP